MPDFKSQSYSIFVLWASLNKRVRRSDVSSSLAGESSVERVLDGGGVPLMRERAKEGTIRAHIVKDYCVCLLDTVKHLDQVSFHPLRVVSSTENRYTGIEVASNSNR